MVVALTARMAAHIASKSDSHVAAALKDVLTRMNSAKMKAGFVKQARLVAVSKTKPIEAIEEAYTAGHRNFGENYVQELLEKSPALPADIRWHFIGHLQSNKAKSLVEGAPGLAMVETVDSAKLANKLDAAVRDTGRPPLPVMVQVNTSGEESKFGVEPAEAATLAQHVVENCRGLKFNGLMTIGMPDYTSTPENFKCLAKCREEVCARLGMPVEEVELSMGMSGDFELAIEMGSTNVRVGSTIFGARDYSAKR